MQGATAFSPSTEPAAVRLPSPVALAVFLLALSALAPADWRVLAALAAIIVLGVPHGALDGEIARDLLRPRFGRAWFAIFAAPYLLLSACVLVAWHVFPLATLAGFLAASTWHFGSEEAANTPLLERLVRGGLPIAVPVLAHPVATATVFATVTRQAMDQPPEWLSVAASAWTVLAIAWGFRIMAERVARPLLQTSLLLGCFLILPPLTAFALYFIGVHAPAHTRTLIAERGIARRVHDSKSAVLRALPLWVMTIALGAALWPFFQGPAPARLLSLTLQGLAALTLPHMLLEMNIGRLQSYFDENHPSRSCMA